MEKQLSPETVRRMNALFAPHQRDEVSRLLVEECGSNLPFLEEYDEFQLERFRFAALKLSEGNFQKLREAVQLAKIDWRDLLVAAEFADDVKAHDRWFPEDVVG
jgi:ABC-type siderophore export system fused ATPase/permease subunit